MPANITGDRPDLGQAGPSSSTPDPARPADLALPRDLAMPPDFAVAPGAWDTITSGNVFVESSAATAPATAAWTGDSIERHPTAPTPTTTRPTDFQTATTPTPSAANH